MSFESYDTDQEELAAWSPRSETLSDALRGSSYGSWDAGLSIHSGSAGTQEEDEGGAASTHSSMVTPPRQLTAF